ncbi:uncharacterized protein LOC123205678 [Mangifera indica]|uniref:uncharacterized protein LOC123205678 n=1 Tax=Mangifera indica TaxID=29780 RepID=UPI001CFBDE29|nr:uncharacterized protein LOC123205678 [Mangifera indica]
MAVSSLSYCWNTKMKILSPALKRIWKKWDIRVSVMLSLILQIVLIILGNRRKYNHKGWLKFVLWCVYLSADSIATASLGVISNNLSDLFEDNAGYIIDANVELTAFWAPFLLLHLGGPDTITSYALEDNELWLRHFLGLIVQTGVAIYVLSMAWTGSYLTFLYILMLIAGLIKYGERTSSLWKASSENLRKKFKHKNDEDQVGRRFLKQHGSKDEEGYFVGTDMITPFDFPVDLSRLCSSNVNNNSASDEDRLVIADSLRKVTMSLFLDTILTSTIKETTQYLFNNMSVENAFKIIEMETAFTFDLLYTKRYMQQ